MIVISDTTPLRYHLEIARLRQETNFRVTNAVVLAAWQEAAAAP